jgi:hypothetical protein
MARAVTASINTRLKELRKAAVPALTIRGMADELGIGHSRYAYFEDPKRFKKRELPLDLTRKIAAVLSQRGVDPAEVKNLAGLNQAEAEPEAKAVEATRAPLQFISIQAVLPCEGALRDMFHSLLALVPEGASRAETAEILARWLPTGFAGIGPYLPDPLANAPTVPEFRPPAAPANDHASPQA